VASDTAAEAPGSGGLQDRVAAERYPESEVESTTGARRADPPRLSAPNTTDFFLNPRAIASASPNAIFVTDLGHRVIFVNPAAEQMFGFPLAEVRGQYLHRILLQTPSGGCPLPAWECPAGSVFSTEESIRDHREIFFRKDGAAVHVSVSSAALVRDGAVTARVIIARDVTEEDFARRELSKINDRLASALATAELGVWDTNLVTGEVYWDARMKSMFGLDPDEPATLELANSFIHPDDLHLRDEILRPRPDGARDVQWEWRVVLPDGTIRWHNARGHFRRDESGAVVGAHGVMRDITDQKEAQRAQEHLAAIIRSTEYCIASTDLDGNITSWNPGAEAMFGCKPEETVGRSAAIFTPPDHPGEMDMLLSRLRRGETVEHSVTERLTKDGRRISVSISLSPLRDASGAVAGVAAVARDVTRERQLEEKLRQAEKMEAIGRLAGGIAHDFNNLLTIVIGCADQALTDAEDDRLRDQLAAIKSAGEYAADLTHRLLALGRKQVLQPQIVDVNQIVGEMLPLLRRVIRASIECNVKLDAGLSCVNAEPGQTEEVLLNLVLNASDAIVSRGVIAIETRNVLLDDEYVRLHPDAAPGEHAMLAVHDNGAGIDPAIQLRIFEPFFTTKPVGKGTGLGLSVVYGIARQSGGHVTCDSDPAAGTTFAVYLPVVRTTASPAPAQGESPQDAAGGSETILLAEDNAQVRAWTARFLRTLGYTVLEAASGPDAVAVAGSHRNLIDLLVTDVIMPEFGGPALVAALRPIMPRMQVLYISGYTGHTFDGMGAAFLAKPFTPPQLARKVREVLHAPAAVSSEPAH
jgi:PAS domain S-box-containing protein